MPEDRAHILSLEVLDTLFGDHKSRLRVRLWDGSYWPDEKERLVTMVLKHPGALRCMFVPGDEVSMGEAYLYDDIDIEGNAEAIFAVADDLLIGPTLRAKVGLASRLLRLPGEKRARDDERGAADLEGEEHCIERDREAVRYHYDVSNDFYSLWLDERMVYSCAYFRAADDDLTVAQMSKLDHICRKLRLQPGQRLLDIGCGWGGLLIHAAKQYGVEGIGITLSEPQAELANARIAEAGLEGRCRVELCDYREMGEDESFDALVSVGMFEHVGERLLPEYFAQAYRLLRPGGLFMNHGIARSATAPEPRGRSFRQHYVFPDGELVPISTSLKVAEDEGFEVRDVESLREHYALTLRHWVRRLEARHEEALQFVEEPVYRVWRLYMSGSAHAFASGRHNVYQSLLVKQRPDGASGMPLTRADWYREA